MKFRFLLCFLWVALLMGAPPKRVVSQTVGTDELLLALTSKDRIAALSHIGHEPEFSATATEVARYPQLRGGGAEDVLRFKPDLVLFSSYSRVELVAQVRRAGVKVIVFDRFNTLEDVYANLRLLGHELGEDSKAEAIIASCRKRVDDLANRLKGVERVRVIAPSSYGFTAGTDTTFQDLCDHAGAINVAAEAGLKGHAATPTEQMLGWKVDQLVMVGEDKQAALKKFKGIPPYQFMEVTRQGRGVLLKNWQLSCVSHHRISAYETLARQLHPERFP
jgi:iron complex transport system substrate-binding protein